MVDEVTSLKRDLIRKDFSSMNDMQKEAIFRVNGPLLILAGAGSGKTTVIVNRIVNLIKYGNAYNEPIGNTNEITPEIIRNLKNYISGKEPLNKETNDALKLGLSRVAPENILAITFTNKAANELKERVSAALGSEKSGVWVSTFHSMCNSILRKHASYINFTREFTIYDDDDSKKIIKECESRLGVDEKEADINKVKRKISRAKDAMISPQEYSKNCKNYLDKVVSDIYTMYQKRLVESNAMDFDDLIPNTIKLLRSNKDILNYYLEKFKYIMVDEYQDTNACQYELIKLLASGNNNICVVGDDDQSIYKFRGANIENILNFEKNFKNTKVIKLEQNYRSTGNILSAANSVICNNKKRKNKSLWTDKNLGEKLHLYIASTEDDEARFIAKNIKDLVKDKNRKYKDFAILYRVSAQSNALEKVLVKENIPHRIIGEHRFFDRKEVKDLIAYLSVINNPYDSVRLLRIINQPKRSIGQVSIDVLREYAEKVNEPLIDVMRKANDHQDVFRSSYRLKDFADLIDSLIDIKNNPEVSLVDLYKALLEKIKYIEFIKLEKDMVETRLQNIKELESNILLYSLSAGEDATLEGFLEEVALLTGVSNKDETADAVSLMTVHSAKGLEFPVVFLTGLEDGLFPSVKSFESDEEIEEERRLAYVGLTRAKEVLYVTRAKSRMLYASLSRRKESRFISEMPKDIYIEIESKEEDPSDIKFTQRVKQAVVIRNFQYKKPIETTVSSNSNKGSNVFYEGEKVKHNFFGEGVIVSCTAMGSDTLIEINFKNIGSKKLMANFAELERV